MDQINIYIDQFSEKLDSVPTIKNISEQTGVKSALLALACIFLVVCFIVYGLGANLLCEVMGISYPAYMSYRAIEKHLDKQYKQWLSYWMIFGFIKVWDDNTDILHQWIPFYYLLKLVFVIWLFYPRFHGAEKIYERAIKPVFDKYESSLDALVEKVWVSVDTASAQVRSAAEKGGVKAMAEVAKRKGETK